MVLHLHTKVIRPYRSYVLEDRLDGKLPLSLKIMDFSTYTVLGRTMECSYDT